MRITHKRMIEILELHSFAPTDDTAYDPKTREIIAGTSFYDDLGRKDSYRLCDVKVWLGY